MAWGLLACSSLFFQPTSGIEISAMSIDEMMAMMNEVEGMGTVVETKYSKINEDPGDSLQRECV